MDGLKYCELHQDTVQVSWQLLSPRPPPGARHLIISMEITLLFYLSLIIFPTPNWWNHSLLFLKLCNVTKSPFFLSYIFCILLLSSLLLPEYSLTYSSTLDTNSITEKNNSPHLFTSSFYPWSCSKWLLQSMSELLCSLYNMGKEVSLFWIKTVTKFHRSNF